MYASDGKKVFSVDEEQTRTSAKPLKNHRGRILVYDKHGGRHWMSYKRVVESRDADGKIDIDDLILLRESAKKGGEAAHAEAEEPSVSSDPVDGVEGKKDNDGDRERIDPIESLDSIYTRRNVSRYPHTFFLAFLAVVAFLPFFAFFFGECTRIWLDRLAPLTTNIDRIPVRVSLPSFSDVCEAIARAKRSFLGSQHDSA